MASLATAVPCMSRMSTAPTVLRCSALLFCDIVSALRGRERPVIRSLAQRAFVADDLVRSMKRMLRCYDGLMTAWVGRTFLQDLGNWHGLLFSRHRIVGWCGHSLDRASSLEQRRLDRFLSVKKPVRS